MSQDPEEAGAPLLLGLQFQPIPPGRTTRTRFYHPNRKLRGNQPHPQKSSCKNCEIANRCILSAGRVCKFFWEHEPERFPA